MSNRSKTRIPSPARSQGPPATPRRFKKRLSRSVGSPAHSVTGRLGNLMDQLKENNQDASNISVPNRKSVLNDDTDIEIPGRKSWWKRLDEKSAVEVFCNENDVEHQQNIGEMVNFELGSQENKNYSLDLPESSGTESIHSIVIPQRKLFTKSNYHQGNEFKQIIGRRESFANSNHHDKTVKIKAKTLFNKERKQRDIPQFPSNLLNISEAPGNKTKEVATSVIIPQTRNLFARASKRKNMFAEFVMSDSEDEVEDIEPRVFRFKKKTGGPVKLHDRRRSSASSTTTDIFAEDWNLLPSSTMIDHQIEAVMSNSAVKEAKISLLPKVKESDDLKNKTALHSKGKEFNMSYRLSMQQDLHDKQTDEHEFENDIQVMNKTTQSKHNIFDNDENISDDDAVNFRESHENEVIQTGEKKKSDQTMDQINPQIPKTQGLPNLSPDAVEKTKGNPKNVDKSHQQVVLNDEENTNSDGQQYNSGKENSRNNIAIEAPKEGVNKVYPQFEQNQKVDDDPKLDDNYEVKNNSLAESEKQNIVTDIQKAESNHQKIVVNTQVVVIDSQEVVNDDQVTKQDDQELESNNQRVESDKSGVESDDQEDLNDQRVESDDQGLESDDQEEQNDQEVESEDQEADNDQDTEQDDQKLESDDQEEEQDVPEVESDDQEVDNDDQEVNSDDKEEQFNRDVENGDQEMEHNDKLVKRDNQEVNNGDINMEHEDQTMDDAKEVEDDNPEEEELLQELKYDDEEVELNQEPDQNQDADIIDQGVNKHQVIEAHQDKIETESNLTVTKSNTQLNENNKELINDHGMVASNPLLNESDKIHEMDNQETHESNQETDKNQEKLDSTRNLVEQEVNNAQNVENDDVKEDSYVEEQNEKVEDQNIDSSNHNPDEIDEDNDQADDSNQEVEENQGDFDVSEEQEIEQNLENQSEEEIDENIESSNQNLDGIDEDNKQADDLDQEVEENQGDFDVSEEQEIEQSIENQSEEEIDNEDYQDDDEEMENAEYESELLQDGQNHDSHVSAIQTTNSRIETPDAILQHDNGSGPESFKHEILNTTDNIRENVKSKSRHASRILGSSNTVNHTDGSRNATEEGSGWDSHRTTRKTLRQTFGKDFTPRKSLRTLVMEKSAKHQILKDTTVGPLPRANSTEYPKIFDHNDDMVVDDDNDDEADEEEFRIYLEKIKMNNMERRMRVAEAVKNSLKGNHCKENLYKVPSKPINRKGLSKPTNAVKKAKTLSLLSREYLPPEFMDDIKYKPPKRFQPSNAPWMTKRFYGFLESKLEPRFNYKSRVRAEKLAETLYCFTKVVKRNSIAPLLEVDKLKEEMARLNIVKTHFEFYQFIEDYLPRELRVKIIPDIVNRIPKPREGIFSDIPIRNNKG